MGKERSKKIFKGFISGNILRAPEVRRSFPYALFVALLMFLYIVNGYHTQKLNRRNNRLTEQVKELRAKSLAYSELRMTATRRSRIIEELHRRGIILNESLTPPKVVE